MCICMSVSLLDLLKDFCKIHLQLGLSLLHPRQAEMRRKLGLKLT